MTADFAPRLGPLFDFIRTAIVPGDRYLVANNRRPLSPARIARYGLKQRQGRLRAKAGEARQV